jgi:hypothetical protein
MLEHPVTTEVSRDGDTQHGVVLRFMWIAQAQEITIWKHAVPLSHRYGEIKGTLGKHAVKIDEFQPICPAWNPEHVSLMGVTVDEHGLRGIECQPSPFRE